MRPFFNQANSNIKILNFLEQHNNCTFTKIADELQIDRATLTKNIKQLKDILDRQQLNGVSLTISKQGINYFRKADFNLAALMPVLTDQRLAIIFESSFNEHYETITALANKLYISPSTTRRLLSYVNRTLSTYQVTLNPKTLRLEGRESNIRYVSFQYYWNTYGSVTWPFIVNEQEILQSIHVQKYDQLRFSFWQAICRQRKLRGHRINSEESFLDLIQKLDFEPLNSNTFDLTQSYLDLFGDVPMLYDRTEQLQKYLNSMTARQRNLLKKKYQHPLLMLKVCEFNDLNHINTFKAHLKFQLLTDSDDFSRQKTIQTLQNHFDNIILENNDANADFILTNLTLRNSSVPTIYINIPLQNNDYESIAEQIQKYISN